MARVLSTAFAAFAAYLLFAGSLSVSELATGAVLASATASWAALARGASPHRFAFRGADLRAWARAIGALPRQSAATATALARAIARPRAFEGRADERPFRQGPRDDPHEQGRRAAALLAASLAPASFVVEIGPDRDRALLHGLGRTPPAAADPERLA